MLTCTMCITACTDQKAMHVHTGGRAHKTRKRRGKLASVNQQLATHYASLVQAPFSFDSAVFGRENQATVRATVTASMASK